MTATFTEVGGLVTTAEGRTRLLTQTQCRVIAFILGDRVRGTLAPIDGQEAMTILAVVDDITTSVGDCFHVIDSERRLTIHFDIVADGLAFTVLPM